MKNRPSANEERQRVFIYNCTCVLLCVRCWAKEEKAAESERRACRRLGKGERGERFGRPVGVSHVTFLPRGADLCLALKRKLKRNKGKLHSGKQSEQCTFSSCCYGIKERRTEGMKGEWLTFLICIYIRKRRGDGGFWACLTTVGGQRRFILIIVLLVFFWYSLRERQREEWR